MALDHVSVVALDVDQGMGTLITVHDDQRKTVAVILVDLGADSTGRAEAGGGITQVISAIKQRKHDTGVAMLDMLIVSHQDRDHWSLLPGLLNVIRGDSDLAAMQVGRIVTGGLDWGRTAGNTIKTWQAYFHTTHQWLGTCHSDYVTPGAKQSIGTFNNVAIRVVVANGPVSRSARDLVRNGTSAVIAIEVANVSAVLPGDGTADTMGYINQMCSSWVSKGKGVPVRPCRVLAAPHHGALRTFASNFLSSNPNLDIGTTFTNYMQAENVVASAGYLSKHKHPNKQVMDLLASKTPNEAASHDYIVFDDSQNRWDGVTHTKKEIYTTILGEANPPPRTSWEFSIDATGTFRFGTYSVEELERRKAQPGPLPTRVVARARTRPPV